jgi:ComF family protein
MRLWQQLIQPLRQNRYLLVQGKCPCCQRSTARPLCPTCERQFQTEPTPNSSLFQGYPFPLLAAGLYQGQLKRILAALKYKNQNQLGPYLGEWLGRAWQSQQSAQQRLSHWLVVPIPLHVDKQQQRGYNQAELIAQGFCRYTNLPLAANGLVRKRLTTPQFGLDLQARQHNLINAFQLGHQLNPSPSPRPVILLLDDIFTTGTTVISAQKTFQQAGFRVGGVVAAALTPQWAKMEPSN